MPLNTHQSLLIFDLDGTLIDSVPDLADAVNRMLTALNKAPYAQSVIRHWVGNGSRKLIERALTGQLNVRENSLEATLVNEAETLFFAAYDKTCSRKTVAYPGVDAGLRHLHAIGFTLALVTNKPMQFVPAILQKFAWDELFSLTLGGDSLASKKPDPAPLQYVCQQLHVPTSEAVMIGDSNNDILAGQRAGIDTLGLSYGYNYGLDISALNPTATFDTFSALVDYLCAQAHHPDRSHQ